MQVGEQDREGQGGRKKKARGEVEKGKTTIKQTKREKGYIERGERDEKRGQKGTEWT